MLFIYSTGKTNFANEHKVCVPTYFRFTSCRNSPHHVPQDGLACTVYRVVPGPAHYYVQGCHLGLPQVVEIVSEFGAAGTKSDIRLTLETLLKLSVQWPTSSMPLPKSLPLLKQLHWLPVNYIIKPKLSTLTYRALAIHQPLYLASLLHFSNIPRQLRSSTSQQLSIPRTKLNLGKRAFSVAAPIIWNEFPTTLKSYESLASLRKNLSSTLLFHHPRLLNMINDFVLLRF